MKYLTILLIFCTFTASTVGQVIYADDFESYNVDDQIVQSNGQYWETFGDGYDIILDPKISNQQSLSGDNSLNFNEMNDAVLRISDTAFTEGRFKISYSMFVDSSSQVNVAILSDTLFNFFAYLNLINFDVKGNAKFKNRTFLYPQNLWFSISMIIDLDENLVTLNFNDEEILTLPYILDSDLPSEVKNISGINIYGFGSNGNANNFYVDDIRIEKISKPDFSWILEAVETADRKIDLSWSSVPNSVNYHIYNGSRMIGSTMDTNWTIIQPYPQEYDFQIRSLQDDEGYHFSPSIGLDFAGGKSRDFVLYELATYKDCVACNYSLVNMMTLIDSGYNIGAILYREGSFDSIQTPDGVARNDYYNAIDFPVVHLDGEKVNEYYLPILSNQVRNSLERRVLYDMNVQLHRKLNGDFKVKILIEELFQYYEGVRKLRIALTESDLIPDFILFGNSDFVLRKMYPDADGITLELEDGTWNHELEFDLPSHYILENCELVVFLQDEDSKDVLTGAKIKLSDAIVAVNEVLSESVDVFPNPCTDYFELQGLQKGTASIQSLNGQTVMNFDILGDNQKVDVGALQAGAYVLNIETPEGLVVKKFIKK